MLKFKELAIASSLIFPSACATGHTLERPPATSTTVEDIQTGVKNQTEDICKNCAETKIKTLAEDENGNPIVKSFKYTTKDGINAERYVFFNPDGTPCYDYYTERNINPELTPDEYIRMLSKVFNSPARWEAYARHFLVYTHDSPNPNNQLEIGTPEDHDDYWQLPQETVLRYNEKGQALGDCDDYAFLAKEILAHQKNKSVVIDMPRHAVTVWIKYDMSTKKFHGFSIGTFGFDHNGNRYATGNPDATKEIGYDKPLDALNSVLKKFKIADPSKGVGSSISFQVKGPEVPVIELGGYYNRQKYSKVSIGTLINPVQSLNQP